jgi:uroporphyrin-III C-methyltransferase
VSEIDKVGTVYLIGAGPGDPELITVKGLRLLREADVVLYDRLAPVELLHESKPAALLVDVGKESRQPTLSQDEINRQIVEYARQGLNVARLKGGDPFVFGRGGEEAEACRAAGIPFVIVPGVSSAIAVPAYAGIPVTHRDFASAFTVVTGHENPSKGPTSLDYSALARVGTLIFLMAARSLPAITAALIDAGSDPETPAACIESGTTSHQRTISGTLETIAVLAQQASVQSPAIVVIGAVVALHDTLDWWQTSSWRDG